MLTKPSISDIKLRTQAFVKCAKCGKEDEEHYHGKYFNPESFLLARITEQGWKHKPLTTKLLCPKCVKKNK